MICKKEKTLYVHINKTAGSSIEIAFGYQPQENQHQIAKEFIDDGEWDKNFTFTFVRNPWDRIVSWFLWANRSRFWYDGMPSFDGLPTFSPKGVNFGGHPSISEGWYLALKDDFKSFIRKIENSHDISLYPDMIKDSHRGRWVANQTEWLKNNKGRVNLDFIGKFENLQNDFDKLCDKIGKKRCKLMQAKRLDKRPHYSKFYDKRSMKIIERLYKDDIKRFNYEYEEAPVQSLR
jgi:hypothetical protein